ncbi:NHS-like protein 1 [Salvelinus alpinus]|uniref:NHS-like protein 1 n=1 Tax=Salvelinus alpinus TaxID=8036 RepID=UPI0039FC10C3
MVFISLALKSVLKYFNRNNSAVRLDEDKKWSVHYTSQKPQQETRPSCVDDRRSVLRECSKKLRRVEYGSSQYFSQNPAYLSPSTSENRLHDDKGRNDRHRKKSTGSSPDEDLSAYSSRPPPSPPTNSYEPIDDTVNGYDVTANSCDLTVAEETEWTKPLPLPTPEEKMRQQAQAIAAEIVPINITGEGFERQASFRRALVNTDTLIRQPRNKLTRRKTIAGIPGDVTRDLEHEADEEPGCGGSVVLPGQYSTLGRTGSVNTAMLQRSLAQGPHTKSLLPSHTQSLTPSHTQEAGLLEEERREEERVEERRMVEKREEEREEERRLEEREEERRMDERREEEREEERRVMKPSVRRIRAQRGQGISSLMASLTPTLTPNPSLTPYPSLTPSSSMGSVSLGGEDGGEGFCSLPRQNILSSLSSECSCLSTPYQTFCHTASCSMDHEFLSQSGEGQSTLLGEDWSYEPLLPSSRSSPLHPFTSISTSCQTDCISLCSESHGHGCVSADYATGSNRSPHGNRDHRGLHGHSSNLSGSISLRKSKRPPAPPTRSTSLRFKPGRGKKLRYNYNNDTAGPGEVAMKGSLTSSPTPLSPPLSPGVFEDPWVPRCSSVGRAGADTDSQINHVPHFHSFHQQPNPGQEQNYPASPCQQQPHPSVPRSASAGGVSLLMGLKMAASSPKMSATAGRLQRLASSTSSGYSSECNTPTLSSPLTPSSPQTPSSPLISSSSLHLTSSSSLPRTRSSPGGGGPRPPIPERKSSLLSSPFSSFSSTSSLSSYTSSDSRYPPLPSPPPLPCSNILPPPYPSLPQGQSLPSPLPDLCISHPLPSPPPLPQPSLPSPPPLPQPSLPSPPPLPQPSLSSPPPLPQPSLPSPPPLPQTSLPSPPPLPQPSLPSPPPLPQPSLPSPPPLPQPSLPTPPPLPSPPSLPPPLHACAVRQIQPHPFFSPITPASQVTSLLGFPPHPSSELTENSDLSINSPPHLPPLPAHPPPPPSYTHTPLPPSPFLPLPRVCPGHTPQPLITTQALQGVTLCSTKRLNKPPSSNVEQSQEINNATLTSIMLTDPTSSNVEQSQEINNATLTSIMLTDPTSANIEQSKDINDATLTSIMLTDPTSANIEQSQDINDATLTSIMLTDPTSANIEQSKDINYATLTSIMLTDPTSANIEQSQDINYATLTSIMLTDPTSANIEQGQDINDATLTSIMLTDPTSANVEQRQDLNDATLTSIMLTDPTSANVEQSQDLNDATLTSIMLTNHTSANVEHSQDRNDATLTSIMLTDPTSANVEQSQAIKDASLTSIMLTNAKSTNDAQHIAKSTEAKLNGITLTSAQERGEGMDTKLTSTVLESVGRIDAVRTETEERTPKQAVVLSRPLRTVFQRSSPAAENTRQNGEPTPRQETTSCLADGQPEYSAWAYTPTHSSATPSPSSPHRQKLPVALKKRKIMPPPLLRTNQTDTPPPPPVLIGTPPEPSVPETPPLLGINLYRPEIQTQPETQTQTESQQPIERTTKPQTESQPEPETAYPFLKFFQSQYCVPELPPRPCPSEPCVPELPPRPCPSEPCVPELPARPCPPEPCVPELPARPCPPEPCVPELPARPCPPEPCVPELPPRPCPSEPCVPEPLQEFCPLEMKIETEREDETERETEKEADTETEAESETDTEKEVDTEAERERQRERQTLREKQLPDSHREYRCHTQSWGDQNQREFG